MSQTAFTDNPAAARYELRQGERVVAFAQYRVDGDALHFTHTEVTDEFEGQGLGSELARQALDDVRRRGMKAVPRCAFIQAYIRRHPEYEALL